MTVIYAFISKAYNDMNPAGKDKALSLEDVERFAAQIKHFLSPDAAKLGSDGTSFEDRFHEFVATYTMRTRTGQITTRRPGAATLGLYTRTLQCLVDWSSFAKKQLTFESINETFYTSFCTWLVEKRGLVDASVSNHVKVLKTFMKWSRHKGYHATTAWEQFWRDKRTGDTIALTVDELRRIRDVDLTDKPRLNRIRDIFLLQVYTGMRYGDLLKLAPKHFDDEVGIIRFTTEKTHTACIVPITGPLRSLLEKYPSRLFEVPSGVKFNVYLKELGAVAGMTKETVIAKYVGGKREETSLPRSELLTSHVARRTFATTSLRFGVPEAVIGAVTGHAAKGMLQQHYINFDEETIRDMICKAWEQL